MNANKEQLPYECKPYHSMGTMWVCNVKPNPTCPYALSFGYVFYCNNRNLHNQGDH